MSSRDSPQPTWEVIRNEEASSEDGTSSPASDSSLFNTPFSFRPPPNTQPLSTRTSSQTKLKKRKPETASTYERKIPSWPKTTPRSIDNTVVNTTDSYGATQKALESRSDSDPIDLLPSATQPTSSRLNKPRGSTTRPGSLPVARKSTGKMRPVEKVSAAHRVLKPYSVEAPKSTSKTVSDRRVSELRKETERLSLTPNKGKGKAPETVVILDSDSDENTSDKSMSTSSAIGSSAKDARLSSLMGGGLNSLTQLIPSSEESNSSPLSKISAKSQSSLAKTSFSQPVRPQNARSKSDGFPRKQVSSPTKTRYRETHPFFQSQPTRTMSSPIKQKTVAVLVISSSDDEKGRKISDPIDLCDEEDITAIIGKPTTSVKVGPTGSQSRMWSKSQAKSPDRKFPLSPHDPPTSSIQPLRSDTATNRGRKSGTPSSSVKMELYMHSSGVTRTNIVDANISEAPKPKKKNSNILERMQSASNTSIEEVVKARTGSRDALQMQPIAPASDSEVSEMYASSVSRGPERVNSLSFLGSNDAEVLDRSALDIGSSDGNSKLEMPIQKNKGSTSIKESGGKDTKTLTESKVSSANRIIRDGFDRAVTKLDNSIVFVKDITNPNANTKSSQNAETSMNVIEREKQSRTKLTLSERLGSMDLSHTNLNSDSRYQAAQIVFSDVSSLGVGHLNSSKTMTHLNELKKQGRKETAKTQGESKKRIDSSIQQPDVGSGSTSTATGSEGLRKRSVSGAPPEPAPDAITSHSTITSGDNSLSSAILDVSKPLPVIDSGNRLQTIRLNSVQMSAVSSSVASNQKTYITRNQNEYQSLDRNDRNDTQQVTKHLSDTRSSRATSIIKTSDTSSRSVSPHILTPLSVVTRAGSRGKEIRSEVISPSSLEINNLKRIRTISMTQDPQDDVSSLGRGDSSKRLKIETPRVYESPSSRSSVDPLNLLSAGTEEVVRDSSSEASRLSVDRITGEFEDFEIDISTCSREVDVFYSYRNKPVQYYQIKDIPTAYLDEVNDIPECERHPEHMRSLFESAIMVNTGDEPESPYIQVINNVDDEPTPPFEFYYTNRLYHGQGVPPPPGHEQIKGCGCIGVCDPTSTTCSCLKRQREFIEKGGIEDVVKNHRGFIYNSEGRAKISEYPIFECNDACGCTDDCINRVVQFGRKCHVNIVKTKNKGWGVFAGKRIPMGTFIGVYSGEIIMEEEAEKRGMVYNEIGRTYLFDIDFWYIPKPEGVQKYVVDAFHVGNFTRFLNHSCDPNCVLTGVYVNDTNLDKALLCIFAMKDIEAGQELCFSYFGEDDEGPVENQQSYQKCYCGARKCRKVLFTFGGGEAST